MRTVHPSPRESEMSAEDQELVEEICEGLREACDRAYGNGLDSADIYKTLSHFIHKSERESRSRESRLRLICLRVVRVCQVVRNGFWVLILLSFLSLGLYLSVCDFFHVNPLSQLHDKRCLLPSNPFIMEMTRPIANCSFCTPHHKSGVEFIEFLSRPSKEDFLEVGYTSKPIIIRSATHPHHGSSPAFNFETLRTIVESEPGGVESVSEECQFLPFRSTFKNLQEVFELISSTREWAEPWYIGWSNCHPGVVGKLRTLFPRPEFLPTDSETSAIDWIFIGSPGHGAAMHLDYVRRPSWQTQLSGKKRWTLKPPPECEDNCSDSITFTISAGDMLFLDTNSWYHETYIEGEELSISIGSEYD